METIGHSSGWWFLRRWKRSDKRCEQSKRMVHQSSSTGRHGCTTSTGQTQPVNFKKPKRLTDGERYRGGFGKIYFPKEKHQNLKLLSHHSLYHRYMYSYVPVHSLPWYISLHYLCFFLHLNHSKSTIIFTTSSVGRVRSSVVCCSVKRVHVGVWSIDHKNKK